MQESAENFPNVTGVSDVLPGNADSRDGNNTLPITREKFVEEAMADFESPLIAYATSILQDVDCARDVVQETFIRLCRQDIAKVQANLKSWLFTVCRNRSLDILRKEKRIQPLDDIRWKKVAGPGLQPDENIEQEERLSHVMGLLDRLSANQREVILLKFQQGLSYQEIQKVTGLTTGNIGFLIHTGLKRLRDLLPDDLR
ncbi:MAG: RNA polymerase sigma factor [Luteolibacter sp.]